MAINNFYPRISTIRLPKTTINFRSKQKTQRLYYLGFFIMVKPVLITITFKKYEKKTNIFVHPKSKTSLGKYKFSLEASAIQQPKSVEDQIVNKSSVKKENNIYNDISK